jgi:hypothetical protein
VDPESLILEAAFVKVSDPDPVQFVQKKFWKRRNQNVSAKSSDFKTPTYFSSVEFSLN